MTCRRDPYCHCELWDLRPVPPRFFFWFCCSTSIQPALVDAILQLLNMSHERIHWMFYFQAPTLCYFVLGLWWFVLCVGFLFSVSSILQSPWASASRIASVAALQQLMGGALRHAGDQSSVIILLSIFVFHDLIMMFLFIYHSLSVHKHVFCWLFLHFWFLGILVESYGQRPDFNGLWFCFETVGDMDALLVSLEVSWPKRHSALGLLVGRSAPDRIQAVPLRPSTMVQA